MTAMSKACHANEGFKLHLQEPFQTISSFYSEMILKKLFQQQELFMHQKQKQQPSQRTHRNMD